MQVTNWLREFSPGVVCCAVMNTLTFVSGHAANLDDSCREVLAYLQHRLSMPVRFVNDIDWTERYARLDQGQVDLAWICGAPYVRRMAEPRSNLELLAAPVWQGERYGAKPVYFADVLVHSASPFQNFADLAGATWVYNEPGSLSGYAAMLAHVAKMGRSTTFFGQVTASGAHLQSLGLLLARAADVTCIDSVVLEEHLRRQPELPSAVRVVERIGPLPSMPWVVADHVSETLRQQVRRLLFDYTQNSAPVPLLGFAAVSDRAYDPIRQILRLAGEKV